MVTSLVLVRHGQSTWNAEARWQGQADPPLTDLGRRQARDAALELSRLVDSFDAAASSPQLRAAETADILVAQSTTTDRVSEIERISDLRERSAGPWSGLTKTEIDQQYPGYLANDLRPDGYELDDPLFERVERALHTIGRKHPDQTVLVVCHGGVINTLAGRLAGQTGRMPNLSGYHATVTDDDKIAIGNRFDLLDDSTRTGGDTARV